MLTSQVPQDSALRNFMTGDVKQPLGETMHHVAAMEAPHRQRAHLAPSEDVAEHRHKCLGGLFDKKRLIGKLNAFEKDVLTIFT